MNQIYKKPLTFSEFIATTRQTFKNCFFELLGITALVASVSAGISVFGFASITAFLKSLPTIFGITLGLFIFVLYIFSFAIAGVASALIVKNSFDTQKPFGVIKALQKAFSKLYSIVTTHLLFYGFFAGCITLTLLLSVLTTLPFFGISNLIDSITNGTITVLFQQNPLGAFTFLINILLALIAIYIFIIYFSFTIDVIAFTDKSGYAVLKESYKTVKGNWWKMVLYFAVLSIPVMITQNLFKGSFLLLFIAYVFCNGFSNVGRTVLYLNLNSQK